MAFEAGVPVPACTGTASAWKAATAQGWFFCRKPGWDEVGRSPDNLIVSGQRRDAGVRKDFLNGPVGFRQPILGWAREYPVKPVE